MIYLDYVATTPLRPEVLTTYNNLLEKYFFNAYSIYDKGIEVNRLMEHSRKLISEMLKVKEDELIFTSCGSESNNLAIKGVAFQYQNRGKHIITTAIEHSSVYETCKELEKTFGFEVTYLKVDQKGRISLQELQDSIRDDTILVSIMYVNNEIGVINPIEEIKQIVKKYDKIKLHFDMVQALGKLPINLTDVDLASFSAHKIYGLKGSGLLFKRRSTTIVPLINGGQQEFGLRGGTSNACSNIVFAKTLRLALEDFDNKAKHIKMINSYARKCLNQIEGVIINSDETCCISSILNFSCPGYKPEVILHDLESEEIYLSTRSACSSKSENISRIMAQLNLDKEIASSALRISFGEHTTIEDIDKFCYYLQESLRKLKKQR
ncbi:cysteine desulfurase [Thomasclavelia spiroformis DSM 1552]|uniref:Aminotransferase, class V n=1 Tax=Thomasclavelia spiroformis DSM 1552 TaxID=428126 RepID=B1C173_9FIRM|nr:cysteine desulfurase family protein [Thomasclavelia spiroformis]EDS75128.1 aminotransferase, class V [Thomasclavelia spiroformis DSM 1552]UWO88896.1 cysteine desulfurase [Thomasclavelia spiroformis DSM 1552]